ncbi:MAG: amidohydrolase [Phycisphaerales bacterium]|nr:amidohydrolase [Phycisphaerales bacterium]
MTKTASVVPGIEQDLAHVIAVRHELHRHPELGYEERRTCEVIERELEEIGVEYRAGLAGGTGVAAWLPATTNPERATTIGLRADIDALPIHEETGLAYASEKPGVMHACGHDGHTANLIGVARALSRLDERPNNVLFVFQPAEEGGAGAERMCADGVLDGTVIGRSVDRMFGLHGWPELEVGKIATRNGPLLASTDEIDITIRGRGCHAAYPHLGVDPVVITAHVITALQTVASRTVAPVDSVVVTFGAIHGGEARNVIPNSVTIRGTVRTLSDETRKRVEQVIRQITTDTARAFGGEAEIEWNVGYPVTKNDPEMTDRVRTVGARVLGGHGVLERPAPTMGGEDFSYYGQRVPASFFFVGLKPKGAASYPNLHTPRFDFNDDALGVGIGMMCGLALQRD